MYKRIAVSLVVLAVVGFGTQAAAQVPVAERLPESFLAKIPMMSGMPSLITAQTIGLTEMMGKPLSFESGPPGRAKAKKLRDVPIGADPTKFENEPTVVASPNDRSGWWPDPTGGPIP
jgi:hypothetical protein